MKAMNSFTYQNAREQIAALLAESAKHITDPAGSDTKATSLLANATALLRQVTGNSLRP